MDELVIGTIQLDIIWENPKKNFIKIEELLGKNTTGLDLIILPEMFTTGFSMDALRIAEKHDENMLSLTWMRKMAEKHGAVITGSIAVEDRGKYYNRLYWVKPSGEYSFYDKQNLFSFAGEDKSYTAGVKILIENINGWKILPLICFDLRFSELSKNSLENNQAQYDLLLYVANWPEKRRAHWQKLLLGRAIENQSYLAAVNRVGKDKNGNQYAGDSVVVDFLGDYVSSHQDFQESLLVTSIKKSSLLAYRKAFPVLK